MPYIIFRPIIDRYMIDGYIIEGDVHDWRMYGGWFTVRKVIHGFTYIMQRKIPWNDEGKTVS
jgi:hypothetical protein